MTLRIVAALTLTVVLAVLVVGRSTADEPATGAPVVEDTTELTGPDAAVPGVTATPESSATAIPFETAVPGASSTPKPTPVASRSYVTPGYGNAAQQQPVQKQHERKAACKRSGRPPTSHMLSVPGVIADSGGANLAVLILSIALGAAVVAVIAARMRRRGPEPSSLPGGLEGVAALIAICGGLAGLAAQFIPAASVKERPARAATMTVRDVKPRITRAEYLERINGRALTKGQRREAGLDKIDLEEVGNVVWLQIGLVGFDGRDVGLQYGVYDLNAHEALLPGTASKPVRLATPTADRVTIFFPAWVGYPRSARFMAEFRLFDHDGVQQIAATGPMTGSPFRYTCPAV